MREVKEIMEQVRSVIKAQNVSQAELVRRIDMNEGYVSRLFREGQPDGRTVTLQTASPLAPAIDLVSITAEEET